jgi:hypothetical protein
MLSDAAMSFVGIRECHFVELVRVIGFQSDTEHCGLGLGKSDSEESFMH